MADEKKSKPWASSLAEVKRNATADITCPSGSRYTVRPLTLDELCANEALPDDLLRAAALEQMPPRQVQRPDGTVDVIPGGLLGEISERLRGGDKESLQAVRDISRDTLALRDRVVLEAVEAPKLKPSDLAGLDPFDKAMIAAAAQHALAEDATGKAVGADSLASFRAAGQQP